MMYPNSKLNPKDSYENPEQDTGYNNGQHGGESFTISNPLLPSSSMKQHRPIMSSFTGFHR